MIHSEIKSKKFETKPELACLVSIITACEIQTRFQRPKSSIQLFEQRLPR